MEKKIYAVKLKFFGYIAYYIIAFGLLISATSIMDGIADNGLLFTSGLLTLLVGAFFFYYSKKERRLIVDEKGVEYQTSKPEFSVEWENLALLKSFQEEGKKTENLIIMDDEDNVLSISTAFFDKIILKDAFNYIAKKIRTLEHSTIEDDRNWLSDDNS